MNGNGRLYRSTSEATIGGVAGGLGNYFKVDPTLFRLGFVLATIATGGAFLLVYIAMWLLIPTVGSTATEPGQILQENANELGAKLRSFVGGNTSGGSGMPGSGGSDGGQANGQPHGNGGPANVSNGPGSQHNQAQLPQAAASVQPRPGVGPMVLITIGAFFLLANMGVFRGMHWGIWWPLLLVGLGAIMLTRRR